jgi:hypothetical protein
MTEINNLRKSLEEDQRALPPIYVFDYPLEVPGEYVEFCQNWHGGQWSAFYSISCIGVILDEETLNSVDSELRWVEKQEDQEIIKAFRKWLDKYLDNDQT